MKCFVLLYFTTYSKVRETVNEMLRILLRIPTLNKQLMKCFVLYIFTTYTKVRKTVNEMPLILLPIATLNKQLMKCFILHILLCIPRYYVYYVYKVK